METSTKLAVSEHAEDFRRGFETGLNHEYKRLGHTHPLFINGRACRSSAPPFRVPCPADTRTLLGRFQHSRPDHVAKAVRGARIAFPFWRELGWEQRVAFVRKVAELMEKHQYELAALLCLEAGKTRLEAHSEVIDSIGLIQYYCQQMEGHQGYRLPVSRNGSEQSYDTLEPYGIWAVVAPCYAPLSASANMIVSAVLAGNTVLFKPSSRTPLTALRLYELFHQAGFPIGILNYLTGPGREIGPQLASHPEIDGLIFCGSRQAGLAIHHQFNREVPRPCVMEMGGSNPALVMPSADLEDAAEGIFRSAFSMCGQHSAACCRVYVHQQICEDFLETLLEKLGSCRIGIPQDPDTSLGPLISKSAVSSFQRAVRIGKRNGRLLWGGRVLTRGIFAHGYFVEPTVIRLSRKDKPALKEPCPGPILTVAEVKSLREALDLANESPFGLTAGIFTQVEAEQEQFFDQIEVGTAFCNRRSGATSGARPGGQSFGGWKGSSSTGKNALGPYYVTQFMREQSRTLCW